MYDKEIWLLDLSFHKYLKNYNQNSTYYEYNRKTNQFYFYDNARDMNLICKKDFSFNESYLEFIYSIDSLNEKEITDLIRKTSLDILLKDPYPYC